ncbi:MAG: L-amino acid N-acyltransferase YncA [Myxococcota bacterium]
MQIRLATPADLPTIAEIYDESVLNSVATFDTIVRSADEVHAWFTAHRPDRHPVFVVTEDDSVLGWASLSPWSPRPAYDRCAEISVYIHSRHQGRGLGRALMGHAIDEAPARGIRTILTRIESSGTASIKLHESFGFSVIGTMHQVGFKHDQLLDVVMMERVS